VSLIQKSFNGRAAQPRITELREKTRMWMEGRETEEGGKEKEEVKI